MQHPDQYPSCRGFVLHWHRWPKVPPPPTRRQLAAARKAVERDIARAPLFPETARFASAEERVEARAESTRRWYAQQRATLARHLCRLRCLLHALDDDTAAQLAADWNARFGPKEPAYLLTFLRSRGII